MARVVDAVKEDLSRVHRAYLAGQWYPGTDAKLRRELGELTDWARREYPEPGLGPVRALIAPHAGLAYSGGTAAASWVAARDSLPHVDTVLVFGAVHRVRLREAQVWPQGFWQTPMANIDVDTDLVQALVDAGVAVPGTDAHNGDNAIELQAPFIAYLFPEAKITAVALPPLNTAYELGQQAYAAAQKTGKTILAAASTDLTHYGAAFGCMPAGTGQPALDWTKANDQRFLDTLLNGECDKTVAVARRDGSACGAGAAAAAAGWAFAAGAQPRLLRHTNSYESCSYGVAEHIVGYASVIWEDRA